MMLPDCRDLLVAIPAYNAAETLGSVLSGVMAFLPAQQVLVIDDGSSDATAMVAQGCGALLQRHVKNRGKGAALRTAFEYVRAHPRVQALISMDADGQHLPQELPRLVAAYRSEPHLGLIIGSRRFEYGVMPFMRVWSNRLTSALLSLRTGQKVRDSQCGYRLYARKLVERIEFQSAGYEAESEILIRAGRAGFSFGFVPISTVYEGERSHIRGWREIRRFVRVYWKT